MVHVRRLPVLFVLVFITGTFHATAQDREVDSIKALLQNNRLHDTTRLALLGSIMERVKVSDSIGVHYNAIVGKIVFNALKKKNLPKKERDIYLLYQAFWYSDKAIELFSAKNGRQVIDYLNKAEKIFRLLKMEDEAWITVTNKGNVFRKMSAWDEAISCYFSALKYQEKSGDISTAAATQGAIATVYEDQGNLPKALAYNKEALKGYETIKDPGVQGIYEKSVIIHNIGFIYYKMGNFDEAMRYYSRSMKISKDMGFSDHHAFIADKIGNIYASQGNYSAAEAMYKEGLSYAGGSRVKANVLISIGELYRNNGAFSKSVTELKEALKISLEIEDSDMLQRSYRNLYKTYKAMGESAKALEMYEQFIRVKTASREEEAKNILAQQELKYTYEKKELLNRAQHEKKLASLKAVNDRRNARNSVAIIFVSVFFLAGMLFLFYYFRQKSRLNAARNEELKQKLLLTQMNPHFIFNSVDNIQSLIYNKQDKEAISYLTKFSKLTRQILENSRENYILLSEEIAMLDNYMTIQKLLYNNNFTYDIQIAGDIDPESLLVPPMLTQPFIENAIRHGLKSKKEGGLVKIHYYTKNDQLQFEVIDNGSGLLNTSKEHKSLSTQITRERLQSIAPGSEITIQTTNILDADNVIQGVRTWFEIPYVYNT